MLGNTDIPCWALPWLVPSSKSNLLSLTEMYRNRWDLGDNTNSIRITKTGHKSSLPYRYLHLKIYVKGDHELAVGRTDTVCAKIAALYTQKDGTNI